MKTIINKSLSPFNQIDSDELVLQIHNEIDSLDSKIEHDYKKLLKSLQIPTEETIVRKINIMRELGFPENNETIKQNADILERFKQSENIRKEAQNKLDLYRKYKSEYPLDKIVSNDDFYQVLEKYNLIYGPSSAYIKDIPEKNILEIKNAKETLSRHIPLDCHIVTGVLLISNKDYEAYMEKINSNTYSNKKVIENILQFFNEENGIIVLEKDWTEAALKLVVSKYFDSKFNITDKEKSTYFLINEVFTQNIYQGDLYIAAPESHFDMTKGVFNGREFIIKSEKLESSIGEVKDPIAFYKLEGNFMRIVSKWGTSDDQSYLDPLIQNENLN